MFIFYIHQICPVNPNQKNIKNVENIGKNSDIQTIQNVGRLLKRAYNIIGSVRNTHEVYINVFPKWLISWDISHDI